MLRKTGPYPVPVQVASLQAMKLEGMALLHKALSPNLQVGPVDKVATGQWIAREVDAGINIAAHAVSGRGGRCGLHLCCRASRVS